MARVPARHIEPIYNWTPTIDFVTTGKTTGKVASGAQDPKTGYSKPSTPDRIYVCGGKSPNGSVTELRYGLQSHLGLEIPLDESTTTIDTWILVGATNAGTFFILSRLQHSALLHLSEDETEVAELDSSNTWLDLSARTLAAATSAGLTIQITEHAYHVSTLAPSAPYSSAVFSKNYTLDETIISAAVHESRYAAIAVQSGGQTSLDLLEVKARPDTEVVLQHIGQSIVLADYPTCIEFMVIDSQLLVLCGTARSTVDFYAVSETAGLYHVQSKDLSREREHASSLGATSLVHACTGLAAVQSGGEGQVLLCGTRDGALIEMGIGPGQTVAGGDLSPVRNFTLATRGIRQIGRTAVTIRFDPAQLCPALLCCDSVLYGLSYPYLSVREGLLQRIWHTDTTQVSLISVYVHS